VKVLLDYFIFDAAAIGGVYRYFRNLISRSQTSPQLEYQIACLFGEHPEDWKALGLKPKPFHNLSSPILHKASTAFSRGSNILYSLLRMSGSNYDIFHPTYYSLYYQQVVDRIRKPLAVTVYDMIHERYPEYMKKGNTTPQKKKLLCERADVVFAISEHTKKDIVEMLNIPPDKIRVTPLSGGFENPRYNASLAAQLPKKYILYVGGRSGYKNFCLFFRAIAPLLKQDPELTLVCTGGGFNPGERELIKSYALEGKAFAYFVLDQDMHTYYKCAELFVFPSLYEGFGIPLLEAFSSGCPVAASNTSSLPEVGGNAAVYFDPKSESNIASAMQSILYNPDFKSELIQAGLKRAGQFSWDKTMEITLEGYRSILSR